MLWIVSRMQGFFIMKKQVEIIENEGMLENVSPKISNLGYV